MAVLNERRGDGAAHADTRLAMPDLDVVRRDNGECLLRSSLALDAYPRQVNDHLRHWAARDPSRVFLAERDHNGEWRTLTYGSAVDCANRMSQALLARGHAADNPVAALCDNSINMAILKLGAMQVGIPFIPVSPAYSLMSENFAKLKHIVETFTPSLVYVPRIDLFERALKAAVPENVQVVADVPHDARPKATLFDDMLASEPSARVEQFYSEVGPDSVAKILLTSGSTGMPKGVINTQRMMCSNGRSIDQVWPFLAERSPIIVDWLPWNHTFGTNFNFNQIMRHGGTMWIDGGRPVPGKIDMTIKNLREIQPTLLYNVPRGFDVLLPALEQDEEFARFVFERLDIIFYAGSALPAHLWKRLDALSLRTRGVHLPILSALGSTETAPVSTLCHWHASDIGGVGLPVPGVTVKLLPEGGKLEIRIKGPNVTPGYYRQPDLTEKAFDDEGFFRLGDAVKFVDRARPAAGLQFDGRVSENFKLSTGTWVHVGELRIDAISAAAPAIQDAVVAGHDRDEVGLLIFLNPQGCRQICGGAETIDPVSHPAVRRHLEERVRKFNEANAGSSRRIARAILMSEPPSIDGNEITDKGYINQRAVLERRAALVERLFSDAPSPDVLVFSDAPGTSAVVKTL
jgi:feruloyl-CoA synthase